MSIYTVHTTKSFNDRGEIEEKRGLVQTNPKQLKGLGLLKMPRIQHVHAKTGRLYVWIYLINITERAVYKGLFGWDGVNNAARPIEVAVDTPDDLYQVVQLCISNETVIRRAGTDDGATPSVTCKVAGYTLDMATSDFEYYKSLTRAESRY